MPNNVFYRQNDVGAIKKLIDDNSAQKFMVEGDVFNVSSSGSQAAVRIDGSGMTQPAYVMKGLKISQNDRVLMFRSTRINRWIIIGSYVETSQFGNSDAKSAQVVALPSNLEVYNLLGLLWVRWEIGVNNSPIFEVQAADDNAGTNAVTLIVSGTTFIYASTTVKYFRVRSVDANWNKSAWTDWSGLIPSPKIILSKIRVVTAAGAITITTADYIVIAKKTVGAATTVNLPSSPVTGDNYIIKDGKGDAATNNITLTPASGTIDGAATFVMNVNYQSVTVVYNGTEWNLM